MEPDIQIELNRLLAQDYGFKPAKSGKWLQQGECPSCKKKEMFTREENPWVLRCGRAAKCGAEFHVKELYPDLFEDWGKRYQQTPENPNAAADAYLRSARGFDLEKIKGWYTQEHYYSHELKEGSATVRFQLGNGTWWERIIDRAHRFGKRKATFRGEYAGTAWVPPGVPQDEKEIWIEEGIFDAISMLHHGIYSVAALSCNNDLHLYLLAIAQQCAANGKERPRLVWAFDGDAAGRRYMKKMVKKCRAEGWDAVAAVIPQDGRRKLDWNDMHQRGRLTAKDLEEYLYQGSLLMAESPADKGKLIYHRHGLAWKSFPLDFDNRLWWFSVDLKRQVEVEKNLTEEQKNLSKEEQEALILKESCAVYEICSCLPTPLYFMRNDITDESWYYFRFDFDDGRPSSKTTFTSAQLRSPDEFGKRLMHAANWANWSGNAEQLRRMIKLWSKNPKEVMTIDYLGYSKDHKTYVYNAVAVKDGRVVEMNDEDYFDTGDLSIKSLFKSLKLDLNTDIKSTGAEWFDKFYLCFGPRGIAALAYWMGTLFAEQIRHRFESFPFLEIVGEPGAGKSSMLEFMWKLMGRDGWEGDDPMKGSAVGFIRTLAQVSNMPVVLIESDREDETDGSKGRPRQAFHWDSFKSLYNGGSLRTTGVKSSGNDTYNPQFRAALVISQNAPVQASVPMMERIIHVWMDKSRLSDAGKEAGIELSRMRAADVSSFVIKAITQEAKVLELIEKNQRALELKLQEHGVSHRRIQKNHAQLLAMVQALSLATPITQSIQAETFKVIADMAKDREQALAKDHPVVEAFWEAFDYLNGAGSNDEEAEYTERLNHHRDPSVIAVSLNHFVEIAAEARQPIPPLPDLKRLLKTSRQRKFIEANVAVNSAINARYNARRSPNMPPRSATVRCWLFQNPSPTYAKE